jgi:peptidoglycan/LPS O-acetylase OafA/YrhL
MRAAPQTRVEPTHGIRVSRFVAGDPLRALAALWVLLLHTGASTLWLTGRPDQYTQSFTKPLGYIIAGGGSGVQIFFVLSGYLIARPFVHALQSAGRLPRLGVYTASRVLRIYPAFWTVVIIATVIYGVRGVKLWTMVQFVTLRHFDGTNPYAGQLAQAWTLPLEVAFYVIIPIIALLLIPVSRALRDARMRRIAIAVVPVVLWLGAAAEGTIGHNPSTWFFAALGFGPGVFLAATEPYAPAWMVSRRAGRVWLAFATVSGLALLFLTDFVGHLGQFVPLASPLLAAGLVGGLLMHQRASGRCPRVLDNRVLDWLGVRSYGIYIFHFLMIAVTYTWALRVTEWHQTMIRLTFATLVLTIAAADLSWRWVESPALNLRARIKKRGLAPPAEPGPPAPPPASSVPVVAPTAVIEPEPALGPGAR